MFSIRISLIVIVKIKL